MKTMSMVFALVIAMSWAVPADAADYKCQGDSVTQRGSTHFKIHRSGSSFTVSKSGSTKGKATQGSSKWAVSVSGSTKAKFDDRTIYRRGGRWASVSDAQLIFDCDGPVASTLWVLRQLGVI
jgi:hypothetical protein